MSRKRNDFYFIVIGDLLMNRKIRDETIESVSQSDYLYFDSPIAARKGEMTINLQQLTWLYKIQVWGFRRLFADNHNLDRYLKRVFDGTFSIYSAIIFTSRSLEQSRQLLHDYDIAYLFSGVTKQTPVFMVVNDQEEMTKLQEYHQLLAQYCENLTLDYMFIYQLPKTNNVELLEKIQKDFLLLDSDTSSPFQRMCIVCHDDQQPMHIYNNYVICDSCDPKDIDEDKVQAWLRLNK